MHSATKRSTSKRWRPNPEERLDKAGLTIRISDAIRERCLKQAPAARILKIDQAK